MDQTLFRGLWAVVESRRWAVEWRKHMLGKAIAEWPTSALSDPRSDISTEWWQVGDASGRA